jgi:perosamine synthetase
MAEPKNDMPLMQTSEGVVLFHPHVPRNASRMVTEVLNTRWIGQGPKVDQFELEFKHKFRQQGPCIAVGSGTDALHIAYLMAGIGPGDEVLCPLFTCTATNLPLLYIGAKPVFVDVNPLTLNMSVTDLRDKINSRTKAIVVVHYGGLPCDMEEIRIVADDWGIPVIEDAAHALGAAFDGIPVGNLSEFTMYSFQAIKHMTTGDGGMLTFKDASLEPLAKRLRWFGINREDKQKGVWENDIHEVGYKYQMTDISAAIGLAGLQGIDEVLYHRRFLYKQYLNELKTVSGIRIVDDYSPRKFHAAWLFTIIAEDRLNLQLKLREHGIESGQTHYRNDRYSVFGSQGEFPRMDSIDDNYLILPLHTKMDEKDVSRICEVIRGGW